MENDGVVSSHVYGNRRMRKILVRWNTTVRNNIDLFDAIFEERLAHFLVENDEGVVPCDSFQKFSFDWILKAKPNSMACEPHIATQRQHGESHFIERGENHLVIVIQIDFQTYV